MATRAPSAAGLLAIPAPMPREPPVTSAVLPSNFLDIANILFWVWEGCRPPSKLRTAVDAKRVAGDPARLRRGEEGHGVADVIGLRDALERLQAEREVAALVGLGKGRHVGGDDAGRDRIDPDTAPAERRRKMLHQPVDRTLGCCI